MSKNCRGVIMKVYEGVAVKAIGRLRRLVPKVY